MQLPNEVSIIALLAFASLLPYLMAAGTCFIKFSIVFSLVRNAIGLQEVPSNITLQGVALIMTCFVMAPVASDIQHYATEQGLTWDRPGAVHQLMREGLGKYKGYLRQHADAELVSFFANLESQRTAAEDTAQMTEQRAEAADNASIFSLLPAYALSEIKSAFTIGFYIYLPFIVVDLLVSNILLALGMMMMSPVTISLPIKLVLFVAMDGWSKLAKGLITPYIELWQV